MSKDNAAIEIVWTTSRLVAPVLGGGVQFGGGKYKHRRRVGYTI